MIGNVKLIPAPTKESRKEGNFTISESTVFTFDNAFANAENFFFEELNKSIAFEAKKGDNGTVQFVVDSSLEEQAYTLVCTDSLLTVGASSDYGAFYAVQSLFQLLNLPLIKNAVELSMPCVDIFDEPRFKWRGLLFDVARHFVPVDDVKRVIDQLAMHKLNVLHWHLTDDQGWRIEIKKYPLLTEIGSKRPCTSIGGWRSLEKDDIPHEGFYTQDDIRDIIEYAGKRHIMVVPEIDMPAHFAAALAGHNWLGCREIESEVQWYFGGKVPESQGIMDWNRPICAGKDTSYEFIKNLLDEVTELFPAPYFHIGGDEAPKDEWKKCPHCQAKMKENGLKDEEELQGYLNNYIQKYLETKNVQLIGWNEILEAKNLDRSIIGQYWTPQRDKNVQLHLEEGGEIIMSCHNTFYFDMCYGQIQLQKTYAFEPRKFQVAPEYEKQVKGIEGALWAEFIPNREKREVTLHPRMAALSEVGWTPANRRNFKEFTGRLDHLQCMYKAMDIDFARPEIAYKKGYFRRVRERAYWYEKGQMLDVFANRKIKADEQ